MELEGAVECRTALARLKSMVMQYIQDCERLPSALRKAVIAIKADEQASALLLTFKFEMKLLGVTAANADFPTTAGTRCSVPALARTDARRREAHFWEEHRGSYRGHREGTVQWTRELQLEYDREWSAVETGREHAGK